jgi:hypothetical protein
MGGGRGIRARRRARRGMGVGGGVWRRRRGRGTTRQLAPGVSISPVGIGAAGARPTIDPGWQACHQCVGYIYMSAAADPFLAGAGGLVKG